MASVTAFVLIGSPHPFDTAVNPNTMIELWEGSRATWVVRNLSNGSIEKRVSPDSPSLIAQSLIEILENLAPGVTKQDGKAIDMSIVLAPLPGAAINDVSKALRGINAADVHILDCVYSRSLSPWSGEWVEGQGASHDSEGVE